MKKYGLMFIILLLTVSILFNYNQSTKLKNSILLSETLEAKLQARDRDNDTLILEVSSLADDISSIDKQLQDKTETIKLINDKLETDGKILESIDAIIFDNNKLVKELNAALLELKILDKENSKKEEDIILTESQIEKNVQDRQDILELLIERISILEEGISSFSTFSIERIMVKQEIDFLDSIYLKIEKLKFR